jgi:hypothetical protein
LIGRIVVRIRAGTARAKDAETVIEVVVERDIGDGEVGQIS